MTDQPSYWWHPAEIDRPGPRPRKIAGMPDRRFTNLREQRALGAEMVERVTGQAPVDGPAVFDEIAAYQQWYDDGQPPEPAPAHWDEGGIRLADLDRPHPVGRLPYADWVRQVGAYGKTPPAHLCIDPSGGVTQFVDLEAAGQAAEHVGRLAAKAIDDVIALFKPTAAALSAAAAEVFERLAATPAPGDPTPAERVAEVQRRLGHSKGPQRPPRAPREIGRQRGKGAWR